MLRKMPGHPKGFGLKAHALTHLGRIDEAISVNKERIAEKKQSAY
jgi:hypothetical protein